MAALSYALSIESNPDLATYFDHLVGGQFEDIGDAHGIAGHGSKDSLLPTRDAVAVFTRYDNLVTDVKNDVFAIDFDAFVLHSSSMP